MMLIEQKHFWQNPKMKWKWSKIKMNLKKNKKLMTLWRSLKAWKKNIQNHHVIDPDLATGQDHVIEVTEGEEVVVEIESVEKIVAVEVEIDQIVVDVIEVDHVMIEGRVTGIVVVTDTEFNLIPNQLLERFTMEK